jgi:hypothetical protein
MADITPVGDVGLTPDHDANSSTDDDVPLQSLVPNRDRYNATEEAKHDDNSDDEAEDDVLDDDSADSAPFEFMPAPTNNIITLSTIRDNIVTDGTLKTYLADILHFLFFCLNHNHAYCLTEYCIRLLNSYTAKYPRRLVQFVVSKSKKEFKAIIRNCKDVPLVHLDRMNPDTFGLFLLHIRKKDGKFYSRSSYGLKKSAVGW